MWGSPTGTGPATRSPFVEAAMAGRNVSDCARGDMLRMSGAKLPAMKKTPARPTKATGVRNIPLSRSLTSAIRENNATVCLMFLYPSVGAMNKKGDKNLEHLFSIRRSLGTGLLVLPAFPLCIGRHLRRAYEPVFFCAQYIADKEKPGHWPGDYLLLFIYGTLRPWRHEPRDAGRSAGRTGPD